MIDVALLGIIRRWHIRDRTPVREIARRLGISRNTVRRYLRAEITEPAYAERRPHSAIDKYSLRLSAMLKTEAARSRKQRRTLKQIHEDLRELGFEGSYDRGAAFARVWRAGQSDRVNPASKRTKASKALAEAFVYASAALPFGIRPSVKIGEHEFVDGGVADNTPITPLAMHDIDEVWIIRLRPGRINLMKHTSTVYEEQMFVHGVPADNRHLAFEQWLQKIRVVQICPQTDLGGMLTGTLNFAEHRSKILVRQGFRTAMRVIKNPSAELCTYHLRYKLLQRAAFVMKALPGCSFWNFFKRGSNDTASPYPDLAAWSLKLPNEVQPAKYRHAAPIRHAASLSAGIISASLAATAFHESRHFASSLWVTLAVWLIFVFPGWWPRFRRMQGL
ncbi:patatin-like phospholipase family protein [Duganella guangzhouensis]|uniref:patatin-like phospholipase family protein n=1 Tax=Duganella guangzhouensis TaxID=2666084 RepID=UPI0035316CAD